MSISYHKLKEFVTVSSGSTPSKAVDSYWVGTVPWISAKEMKSDYIEDSSLHISLDIAQTMTWAPKDSILILTRGSELFNRFPICWVRSDVTFNQDVKCLNSDNKDLLLYIFYFLKHSNCLKEILDVTGIGAGKIDANRLLDIDIPIPDMSTICKINSTAKSFYDLIDLNNQINDNLGGCALAS